MRTRAEVVSMLVDPGIIAVVRTSQVEQVPPVCEALVNGGVLALEITLTVPQAFSAIRQAKERFGGQALVGAGSVVNAVACREAIQAGADFVVSPVTQLKLVEVAHAADRPIMLGAYTPTEAQAAHEAGADFIKIFPADKLGPGYIRSIRAPLPHLRIVPTGGVDLNTAAEFLKAGCAALGVGSSLLTAAILQAGDWAELSKLARAFVDVARSARS